jgi:WD40 repeat protein
MLARRLARHGLGLSGMALTAAMSQSAASASVPTALMTTTVQSAGAVAAGKAVAAVVSAEVAALTEGAVRAMFITKLKIATAVLLAAGVLLGVALLGDQPVPAQPPTKPERKPEPAKTEKEPADWDAGPPRVFKLVGRGRRVTWSPDGKALLVAEIYEPLLRFTKKGSVLKVWDVETGQVKHTLAESNGGGLAFQATVFSADGKTIAATVSEEVRKVNSIEIRTVIKLWDANNFTLKRTLEGDSQLVSLALSPDGKRIAAVNPGKKTVKVWNAETGALERTLNTGEAQPWTVAFSPDSATFLVTQNSDGSGEVTLWDAVTGKLKRRLTREKAISTAVFSPNGKRIASVHNGGVIELWDLAKGQWFRSLHGLESIPRSMEFSPDSRTLAAAGWDGKVRLWDAETGKQKQTLEGHTAEVYAIAFSPDGKTLASVSQDQTIRLWKMGKRSNERK